MLHPEIVSLRIKYPCNVIDITLNQTYSRPNFVFPHYRSGNGGIERMVLVISPFDQFGNCVLARNRTLEKQSDPDTEGAPRTMNMRDTTIINFEKRFQRN